MKVAKYNDMSVEVFTDIYEYVDTLKTRTKLNPDMADARDEYRKITDWVSHNEDSYYKNFTGTKNIEEANQLLEVGYEEGVRLILDAPLEGKRIEGVRYQTDVIGFAPCIPNAIMGLPDSMIKTVKQEGRQSSVHIIYKCGVNCNTSKEELAKASRLLLDTIASFEAKNIKVKLSILYLMTESNYRVGLAVGTMFTLKEADQKVNLKKISYILVHPSAFRRHFFWWVETCNFKLWKSRNNIRCYGHSRSSEKEVIEHLKGARLMNDNDLYIDSYTLMDMSNVEQVSDHFNRQNKQ